MNTDTLIFSIVEYEEQTYKVETKNTYFRDGYRYDNLRMYDLVYVMSNITEKLNNQGIGVLFEVA